MYVTLKIIRYTLTIVKMKKIIIMASIMHWTLTFLRHDERYTNCRTTTCYCHCTDTERVFSRGPQVTHFLRNVLVWSLSRKQWIIIKKRLQSKSKGIPARGCSSRLHVSCRVRPFYLYAVARNNSIPLVLWHSSPGEKHWGRATATDSQPLRSTRGSCCVGMYVEERELEGNRIWQQLVHCSPEQWY